MPAAATPPTLLQALPVWARIGALGFGGPAGQIALMHRELVEKRAWISEERFLHALSYCTLLPGPEATQLATYIGWLLHRTPGGVAAGTLFVLPGAVVMLALAALYQRFHAVPAVGVAFLGVKAAVLALVAEALVRVGRRALVGRLHVAVAAAAFVALAVFTLPFPLVIAAAGAVGALWIHPAPKNGADASGSDALIDRLLAEGRLPHTRPDARRAVATAALWLVIWWGPIALAAALLGPRHVLVAEGVFFGKAAVVTFGGAYAVLAYVAREAVHSFGWLPAGAMLDGLGLAETTPGPLILVLQFVGYLGAANQGSLGVLGATVTLWATFVPCFLWIFVGAPYVEALRGLTRLRGALAAITAAVVGVIASLATWFARQTLSLDDPLTIATAILAFVALARFKVGLGWVLLGCAALGVARAALSF
jgi:chromate transporter